MAQITLNSSGVASSGSLLLQTNGTTTQATVDTSGNLGLGVTPSAWQSGRSIIELGGSVTGQVVFNGSSNNGFIATNVYNSGSGNLYKNSNYATSYNQTSGQHQWYTAASGTAGNAITFTQAMTLDSSGNLGLGTTSPNISGGASGSQVMTISASSSGRNALLELKGTRTSADQVSSYIRSFSNSGSTPGVDLQFYRGATDTDGYLTISTSGSERARIDSSGNLLVGDTSNTRAARLRVEGQETAYFTGYGNGYGIGLWMTPNASATGGTATAISFQNVSNTTVGSISTTGSATTYSTSSDYRLKENIAPMTGALGVVQQLKPCTYNWKADGSDGQGFIAHELQAVVPDCVTGEKDAVDADGNPVYQGIDTSFLVATLTAAIKEQQALITQLQADVEALKGQA